MGSAVIYDNVGDGFIYELVLNGENQFYILGLDTGEDSDGEVHIGAGTYTSGGTDFSLNIDWYGYKYYGEDEYYEAGMSIFYGTYYGNIYGDDTISVNNGFLSHHITFSRRSEPSELWDFEKSRSIGLFYEEAPPLPQYVTTVTLGDFTVQNNDAPKNQKGWITKWYDELPSPWTARDFTGSQFLIIEFWNEPQGGIDFIWKSGVHDWMQTNMSTAQEGAFTWYGETKLVIDLTKTRHYDEYIKSSELVIYLGYYSDSWDDLWIKDAYFANLR